ncbi:hypothetical protein E3P98_02197 [Wallemia ichthyophaga]|nr:hypothetical protein E3P98_02197 [Wallemia ichthyophaga]
MVYTLIVHMRAKPETVEEVKGKLHEASRIYRNDKETIDWHVMQDPKDATKFAVVERYEQESSHIAFDPYVVPRLAEEMQLSRFEEF